MWWTNCFTGGICQEKWLHFSALVHIIRILWLHMYPSQLQCNSSVLQKLICCNKIHHFWKLQNPITHFTTVSGWSLHQSVAIIKTNKPSIMHGLQGLLIRSQRAIDLENHIRRFNGHYGMVLSQWHDFSWMLTLP